MQVFIKLLTFVYLYIYQVCCISSLAGDGLGENSQVPIDIIFSTVHAGWQDENVHVNGV